MSVTRSRLLRTRLVLIGGLGTAWLVVWLDLVSSAARTHWGNLLPEVILAGPVLAFAAGAIAWIVAPAHRRLRFGALAGAVMLATYVAGYLLIDAVLVLPYHSGDGGETAFSLLLESWFWIGIPLLVCAGSGMLGWSLADSFAARGTRRQTR